MRYLARSRMWYLQWTLLASVGALLMAGCELDFFGPDTEIGAAVRTGSVMNEAGTPIAGARVFWSYPGFIVGSGGSPLVPDSAISDAVGNYRLETEHYCNSQLSASAAGYLTRRTNLSYLA